MNARPCRSAYFPPKGALSALFGGNSLLSNPPNLARARWLGTRGPTGGGSLEQQGALAAVAREGCRPLELGTGLLTAPQLGEEVAPYAREEVVGLERRLGDQLIDDLEARGRPERHRERDRAIQLHTGDGASSASASYRAAMRAQS